MPDNEYFEFLNERFNETSDPYIDVNQAEEAIREDYPGWLDAVENGVADWETAATLAALDVDNPYDVEGILLGYDGENWTLDITDSNGIHELDMGENIADWVWEWLQDMAEDFEWDWDIDYGED